MAKKRKESKTGKETKKVKVKTNVRLFRAEDVIWFLLDRRDRRREWLNGGVGPDGWWLEIKMGVDKDGDPVIKSVSSDWISVADELGFQKCEYVLNPDGIHHVMLYDEEYVNAGKDEKH